MNIERIMRDHESDESLEASDERLIENAMREQFENADEVMAAMREHGLTGKAFFEHGLGDDAFSLPVLPVRKCDRADIRKHTKCQQPYMHAHTFYELIYVVCGKSVQYTADGSRITLTAGTAMLLCPGSAHALGRSGDKDVVLKLTVPRGLFESVIEGMDSDVFKGGTHVFASLSPAAERLLFSMLEEVTFSREYREKAFKSLLSLLLIELVRGERSDGRDEDFVRLLYDYLKEHTAHASLSDLAARIGYSSDHLGRRIREKTGRSFSDVAAEYRTHAAAELLSTTDSPVESIALTLGYSSPSGLYKGFVRHFGMTPARYRRASRSPRA